MTLESRLRLGKQGAIGLALEVAIAVAGRYRNRGLTGRSSQERCEPQMLKLVPFQVQVVEWFETRCRRTGIRGIAFVACTSEKPRPKRINQIPPQRNRLSTHLDLPKLPTS